MSLETESAYCIMALEADSLRSGATDLIALNDPLEEEDLETLEDAGVDIAMNDETAGAAVDAFGEADQGAYVALGLFRAADVTPETIKEVQKLLDPPNLKSFRLMLAKRCAEEKGIEAPDEMDPKAQAHYLAVRGAVSANVPAKERGVLFTESVKTPEGKAGVAAAVKDHKKENPPKDSLRIADVISPSDVIPAGFGADTKASKGAVAASKKGGAKPADVRVAASAANQAAASGAPPVVQHARYWGTLHALGFAGECVGYGAEVPAAGPSAAPPTPGSKAAVNHAVASGAHPGAVRAAASEASTAASKGATPPQQHRVFWTVLHALGFNGERNPIAGELNAASEMGDDMDAGNMEMSMGTELTGVTLGTELTGVTLGLETLGLETPEQIALHEMGDDWDVDGMTVMESADWNYNIPFQGRSPDQKFC